MNKGFLNVLLRSENTVFTFRELMLIWEGISQSTAISRVNYYVKTGKLIQLRRGIYAKDRNFNKFEFCTKIFKPSYISFETVLGIEGVIFQKYSSIYLASYQTKEINSGNDSFIFRKLNDRILFNFEGIINKGNYLIASKERAFLDMLYIDKDFYFDNIHSLNFEKITQLLRIYENKRMEKFVNKILTKNVKKNEHTEIS